MKKIFYAAVLVVSIPFAANAQLGGLIQKVKSKVNQRVDTKVDKGIDDVLDKAEGKKTVADTSLASNTVEASPTLKSYAKYDFIPGDHILYYNSFETDPEAELPIGWNTNGTGEVVHIENTEGKWLSMHKPFVYLADNHNKLGDDYTMEFDIMMQLKNNGWMYPTFSVGLFSTNDDTLNMNGYLKDYNRYAAIVTTIYPGEFKSSRIKLESFKDAAPYFTSDAKGFDAIERLYGKPMHVAIQVQKERFRIWINETKVFDVPKAVATGYKMDQLLFKIGQTNYGDDQYGMFISNIKVAEGLPDTRHKLLEEGRFSTTAILFDVNAASIKPESAGALKEIADVLTQNKDVRIRITGHTDSDGSDQSNLVLSQKRAEAVKEALVSQYGIDAARIETDGKGEADPVADNTSKEGKASNRRVEFTRL